MCVFGIDGMYEGEDYIIFNNLLIDYKKNEDDELSQQNKEDIEKLKYFATLPQYEQKSKEWLEQRKGYIGGSEAGSLLGMNKHEPQYKYLERKIDDNYQFINFEMVYHGNKHEDTAKHIYEALTNTHVYEYGFIPGPSKNGIKTIFGASPDGIVSEYKNNLINKTNKVGRMLEIKCPARRKINMDLDAELFDIIPKYYYPQVIQQLETCELQYCDFWQCNIQDYVTEKHYYKDKYPNNEFDYLNSEGKLRGVLFQLLPEHIFNEFSKEDLFDPTPKLRSKIYAHAKFIHPPTIIMTKKEKEEWMEKVQNQDLDNIPDNLMENYKIKDGYKIHKIIYWHLVNARCLSIERNKKFFNSHFYIYEVFWNYVKYFNDMLNYNKKKYLLAFIKYCDKNKQQVIYDNKNLNIKGKKTINKIIMFYVDQLYNYDLHDSINKIFIDYYGKYQNQIKGKEEELDD